MHVFIVAIFCLVAVPAQSQVVINDSNLHSFNSNINSVSWYLQDDSQRSASEIASIPVEQWQRIESDNVSLGLERSTYWAKVVIRNDTQWDAPFYVSFNPIFLEQIAVYNQDGQLIDQTGSLGPNGIISAQPTLKIQVLAADNTFYIQSRSLSNNIAIRLIAGDAFAAKTTLDRLMFIFLIGVMFGLMIYHLFLFYSHRRIEYGIYSLFLFASMFFTFTFTSFHFYYLPPTFLGFQVAFWWSALAAPLVFIFLFGFSWIILKLNTLKYAKFLYILPLLSFVGLGAIVLTQSPYSLILIRISPLIHMLVLPAIGFILWLKNRENKMYLYYTVSWLPFVAGVYSIVAYLSGNGSSNEILAWGVPIATVLQSFLLSFVAGERLNIISSEKSNALKALMLSYDNMKKRDTVISSFVGKSILDEIESGSDPRSCEPQIVKKCVVFNDMRGFTPLLERHDPKEFIKLLNEYILPINNTIYSGGGTVDKIIGDNIMSLFDTPTDCIRTIIKMRQSLSQLNRNRVSDQQIPIKFGSGISYGDMVSANIGTIEKLDRTVIGDIVNQASRIESLTRALCVDILASKEFMSELPGYEFYRPVGYAQLKGVEKKVLVFEIFEHNKAAVVQWKLETKKVLEEVVELELRNQFDQCIQMISELIRKCPQHGYIKDEIMDPTLKAIIFAINVKVSQLEVKDPWKSQNG